MYIFRVRVRYTLVSSVPPICLCRSVLLGTFLCYCICKGLCSSVRMRVSLLMLLTVFNHEPHSGSGGSGFPVPFRTQKDQRHFSNDLNHFRKVLVPFRTRNHRKHFNHLTISYVCLNLSLPFVTAPITIHYKLHSGPLGGSTQVYLRPWYIYIHLSYLPAPQLSSSI